MAVFNLGDSFATWSVAGFGRSGLYLLSRALSLPNQRWPNRTVPAEERTTRAPFLLRQEVDETGHSEERGANGFQPAD